MRRSPQVLSRTLNTPTIARTRRVSPRINALGQRVRGYRVGWADIELLWVTGLALVCAIGSHVAFTSWMHPSVKIRDWSLYFTLGLLFPALTLGLVTLGRVIPRLAIVARIVQGGAVAATLVVIPLFIARSGQIYVLALAACEAAVLFAMLRQREYPISPAFAVAVVAVSLLAWLGAIRLIWWSTYGTWLVRSYFTFAVFVLAFALVVDNLLPREVAECGNLLIAHGANNALQTVAALLALGAASLRNTPRLDQEQLGLLTHWIVFTAPADLVRHGGWLLWDVPSQYGFLSNLAIAFFPAHSVWESFYLLNTTAALL